MGKYASVDPQPLHKVAIIDQDTIDQIAAALPPGSYTHPATHPASMIVEDTSHRFVTSEQLEQIGNTTSIAPTSWGKYF